MIYVYIIVGAIALAFGACLAGVVCAILCPREDDNATGDRSSL